MNGNRFQLPEAVDGEIHLSADKKTDTLYATGEVSMGDGIEHGWGVHGVPVKRAESFPSVAADYGKWEGGRQMDLLYLILFDKKLLAQWGSEGKPLGWTIEVKASEVPAHRRLTWAQTHRKLVKEIVARFEAPLRAMAKSNLSL